MVRVTLTHTYAVSPERLWALVTDLSAFETITRGLVRMRGLPTELSLIHI